MTYKRPKIQADEIRETHTFSHRSTCNGYEPYGFGPRVEKYAGNLGRGYKLHFGRRDSTRLHWVEYWLERVPMYRYLGEDEWRHMMTERQNPARAPIGEEYYWKP